MRYLLAIGALALVLVSLARLSESQKTAQRWSSSSSTGSGPKSVYGGYEVASDQSSAFEQQQQPKAPVHNSRLTESFKSSSSSRRVSRPQSLPVYQQQESYESQSSELAEADAEPASYGAVNGKAGQDFPNYSRVPITSFRCEGLPYDYGMYADEETGCQAYHVCYNGRKDSFLCGPGTVFNQRILHCDYWYSVDCAKSNQYYSINAYMGSSQPEPGPAQASAPVQITQQQSASSYRTKVSRPQSPTNFKQSASSFSQVQEAF